MKYFPDFPVQQQVIERFQHSFDNDRLAHAYLLYGPQGSGKEAFAFQLAAALNCTAQDKKPCGQCPSCEKVQHMNHPDVHYIFPIGSKTKPDEIKKVIQSLAVNPYIGAGISGNTSILIDQIRTLKNESKYTAFEGNKKIYIISGVDKMTRESANSFLKLLEEPPDGLMLILISTAVSGLLDTIRSRCHSVYFPALNDEDVQRVLKQYAPDPERAAEVAHLVENNLKRTFEMLQSDPYKNRDLLLEYLRAAARGKQQPIYAVVDKLHKTYDKNHLKDFLNLVILWLRDSLNYIEFENEARIINRDFENDIKKFAEYYKSSDFDLIVSEVESAITKIDQNVHRPLILTVLADNIRRALVAS